MTTLHATNAENVEATLNNFIVTQLAAITVPAYLSGYQTVADWPESVMPTPCFSFAHFPVMSQYRYQGNVISATESGMDTHQLLEISAWFNRDFLYNGQIVWSAALRYMQSMVQQVVIKNPVMVIQDYSTPSSPTATAYVVRFRGDLDTRDTMPDENPAIKRRRMICHYWWTQRS